ncbi:MAG: gliding motility-associated C-terminal domain-containing protein, partial [Bacteroidota bacterium]
VIILTTQLLPSDTSYINQTSCNPLDTGLILQSFTNQAGCDSLVFTQISLRQSDSTFVDLQSCDPNQIGTNIQNLTNQFGCDSVIILTTQLLPSDTSYIDLFTCNPLDTGLTINQLSNQWGCDSLIYTSVQLGGCDSDTTYLEAGSCDPSLVGMDTLLFSNQLGFDSVVVQTTILWPSDTSYLDVATCNPLDTGLVLDIQMNQYGCDSLIWTRTFLEGCESDTTFIQLESCNPLDVGTAFIPYINQLGFDSIVVIHTTLLPSDTTFLESSSCNPATAGQIVDTLSNQYGCDSIVIENILFVPLDTTTLLEYTCDSAEVATTITQLQTAAGCDSIVMHIVSLAPPIVEERYFSTCFEDETRADTSYFQTAQGCDSLLIDIYFFQPIDFSITWANSICYGDRNGWIAVDSVMGGIGPFLYSIDNAPFQGQPSFVSLDAGDYTIGVQDAEGCETFKSVSLDGPVALDLQLGPDTIIQYGDSLQLTPIFHQDIDTFFWESSIPLSCDQCLNPFIKPVETVIIRLTIINYKGCQTTASRTIHVEKDQSIYIPNIFTPNEDGQNDFFTIYPGEQAAQVALFRVFNRWGEMVYEVRDTPIAAFRALPGWDGRLRGKALNPAVFTYLTIVEFQDGSRKTVKGDVTLIR